MDKSIVDYAWFKQINDKVKSGNKKKFIDAEEKYILQELEGVLVGDYWIKNINRHRKMFPVIVDWVTCEVELCEEQTTRGLL